MFDEIDLSNNPPLSSAASSLSPPLQNDKKIEELEKLNNDNQKSYENLVKKSDDDKSKQESEMRKISTENRELRSNIDHLEKENAKIVAQNLELRSRIEQLEREKAESANKKSTSTAGSSTVPKSPTHDAKRPRIASFTIHPDIIVFLLEYKSQIFKDKTGTKPRVRSLQAALYKHRTLSFSGFVDGKFMHKMVYQLHKLNFDAADEVLKLLKLELEKAVKICLSLLARAGDSQYIIARGSKNLQMALLQWDVSKLLLQQQ